MASRGKRWLRRAAYYIPQSRALRWAAKRYVEDFRGEQNCDLQTNGELRLLESRLPRDRPAIVVDVGANVGNWTAEVLRINPEARIHCFEPGPAAFRELSERSFPDSVVRMRSALSDKPGLRTLSIHADRSSFSSLYPSEGEPISQEQPVECTTLDAYWSKQGGKPIDFLKIDVEGADVEVLRGGTGLLSRKLARLVQIEYGPCYISSRSFLKDVWDLAVSHGYELSKLHAFGPRPIPRYTPELENFQYANYILEPAS